MKWLSTETRLHPTRGLVLAQNRRGKPLDRETIKRWIRFTHIVHKVRKVDVLANGPSLRQIPALLEFAGREGVRLSLRTDASEPPGDLNAWRESGLFDVMLTPLEPEGQDWRLWARACKKAHLPVRLQWQAPFDTTQNPDALAEEIAALDIPVLFVAAVDPFQGRLSYPNAAESRANIDWMNALTAAAAARGIETHLIRLPICLVREENRARAINTPQFFHDHQHYAWASYDLAERYQTYSPLALSKMILAQLSLHTFRITPYDERLLNWLTARPSVYIRVAFWRKLTRHIRFLQASPPVDIEGYQRYLDNMQRKRFRVMGPACAACCYQRVCNHATPGFRRAFSNTSVTTVTGDPIVSPFPFSGATRRYYDAVDAVRIHAAEAYQALADCALDILRTRPADRQLSSRDYHVEKAFSITMEGGVMWFSAFNCEKLTSPLGQFRLPFTLSVTFGGGIADYIGFALDRTTRLLCPMESFRHELTLHVNEEGRYALLRDGHPVIPCEFAGQVYVPERISDAVQPRIAIWNIDLTVVTHLVIVWEGQGTEAVSTTPPRFSVVIVCTKYARRLQATLACLAHQTGLASGAIEILVAYAPGIDAVGDVLDSVERAYPHLRVVRSTFPPERASAKGFMINETVKRAAGDWIVFMDADTLIPPDLFARVLALPPHEGLIAPDGRKMLSPDITAQILLGEIRPWESWESLLTGPGEYRRREANNNPVGFCQFVRTACLQTVSYTELEHFEFSDMQFAIDMRKAFGPELWLEGVPVLHLDHGGSQWYGAQNHR